MKKIPNKLSILGKKNVFARIFCLLALFFCAITFTVAWFQNDIIRNGLTIKSSKIDLEFYGYKINRNEAIEEFHYVTGEENDDTLEADGLIDDVFNLNKSEPAEYYFVVKKNIDCIDLDANISFEISGLNLGETDTNGFLSGYHFYFETLGDSDTSPLFEPDDLADADSVKDRIEVIANEQGENKGEKTLLTEINEKVWFTSALQENDYVVYRLTIVQDYDSPIYQGNAFGISAKLNVAQSGTLQGTGITIFVHNNEELVNAISTYVPGTNIYIVEDVDYTGIINFNRPVNLFIRNATLTVYGNIDFEYGGVDEFNIDTQLGGRIITKSVGGAGGSFICNTPYSAFNFIGTNNTTLGYGDLYIQSEFVIDASNDIGANINKSVIYTYTGNIDLKESTYLKTITLKDDSLLTVGRNTHIGTIFNGTYSVYYVNIINNGTIDALNLVRVKTKAYNNGRPQIDIDNFGTISRIQLPTWSTKFVETEGTTIKRNSNGDPIVKVPVYHQPTYIVDEESEIAGTLYSASGKLIPYTIRSEQANDIDGDPIYLFKDSGNNTIYYYSINNNVNYLLTYDAYNDVYKKAQIDDSPVTLDFTLVDGHTYSTELYTEQNWNYYSVAKDLHGNPIYREVCQAGARSILETSDEFGPIYTFSAVENSTDIIYMYMVEPNSGDIYLLDYNGDYYSMSLDEEGETIKVTPESIYEALTQGNTRVIHEFGSCNLKSNDDSIISGSSNFVCRYYEGQDDVTYRGLSEYVTLIARDGDSLSLQVYYEERINEFDEYIDEPFGGTTLQILIEDYLTNETEGLTVLNISSLAIKSFENKALTPADYTYIRTMKSLTSLDLSETHSEDYKLNNLVANPFNQLYQLSDIKLPNDKQFGNTLFTNTAVHEVRVPASVETISTSSFNNIYYLHLDGYNVLANLNPGGMYIFVPNSEVLAEYRATKAYNNVDAYHSKMFVEAQRYGRYFLRLNGNSADFVTFVDLNSGSTKPILDPETERNGEYEFDFVSIKVGDTTYRINKYDDFALYNRLTNNTELVDLDFSSDNSTIDIGQYAFYNGTGIGGLTVYGNASIGNYAFYNCTKLWDVYIGGNVYVGQHAFRNDTGMNDFYIGGNAEFDYYSLNNSNVKTLSCNDLIVHTWGCYNARFLSELVVRGNFNAPEDYAFYNCFRLYRVDMTNPDATVFCGPYTFQTCSSLAYVNIQGSGEFGLDTFGDCISMLELIAPKITTVNGRVGTNMTSLIYAYLPRLSHYVGNAASFHGTSTALIEIGVPLEIGKTTTLFGGNYNTILIHTETATPEEIAQVNKFINFGSAGNSNYYIDDRYPNLIDALKTLGVSYVTTTGEVTADQYCFYTPEYEKDYDYGVFASYIGQRFNIKLKGNYLYMLDGTVDPEDGNIPNAIFLTDIYAKTCRNVMPEERMLRGLPEGYIYDDDGVTPIAKITTVAKYAYASSCFNSTTRNPNIFIEVPCTATRIENYAYYDNDHVYKLDSDIITYIGEYAFYSGVLRYVNLPNCETALVYAFGHCDLNYAYIPRLTTCGNCLLYDSTNERIEFAEISIKAGGDMFWNGADGAITHTIIHNDHIDEEITSSNLSSDYGNGLRFISGNAYDAFVAKWGATYPFINIGDIPSDELLYAKSSSGKSLYLDYEDPWDGEYKVLFDGEYVCAWVKDENEQIIGVNLLGCLINSYPNGTFEVPGNVTIDGVSYPVVRVSSYCYRQTTFGSVDLIIPETVSYIGSYAFKASTGINSITFKGDVDIADYAFYNIPAIKNLVFKGDTIIRKQAFYTDYKIESIIFEKNVTMNGSDNFRDCPNLTELYFGGDYISNSGSNTFYNSPNVQPDENGELHIHGNARILSAEFRRFNSNIPTLRVDGDLTVTGNIYSSYAPISYLYIGGNVDLANSSFTNSKNLKYIEILGTGFIGQDCFSNCPKLEIVNAPHVTNIKYYAFRNNTSLVYANISGVIQYGGAGTDIFNGCPLLETIDVGAPVDFFDGNRYFLNGYNYPNLKFVFMHTEHLKDVSYTVPISVGTSLAGTKARVYLDSNDQALFDVYLKSIKYNNLYNTYDIRANNYHRYIVDPTDTDSIYTYGYTDAHGVYHKLYESQVIIGANPDNPQHNASIIYWPLSIKNNQFDSLLSFNFDGANYTTTKILSYAFTDATFENAIINLGEHIDFVSDYAFYMKKGIVSVISSTPVTYCDYAFAGCNDISILQLVGVTAQQYAFANLSGLRVLSIDDYLDAASYSFNGNRNVETYDLDCSLTLANYSFNANTGMKELRVYDENANVDIAQYALVGCNLEVMEIHCPITIAASTFLNNTTLKYLEFYAEGTFGSSCFQGCQNLTYLYMSNVTTLPNACFQTCQKLESLYAPMLTNVGSNVFYNDISLSAIDIGFITNYGGGTMFLNANPLYTVVHAESVTPDKWYSTTSSNLPGLNYLFNTAQNLLIFDERLEAFFEAKKNDTYASRVCTGSIHSEDYRLGMAPGDTRFNDYSNRFGETYLYIVNSSNQATLLAPAHYKNIDVETYDIPATLGGYPVVEIGNYAYNKVNMNVLTMNCSNNLKTIGIRSFYGANNPGVKTIASINLYNVDLVKDSGFRYTKCKKFYCPKLITAEQYAFGTNTDLNTIIFGPTLRTINNNMLNGCSNTKYIFLETTNTDPATIITGNIAGGLPTGANIYLLNDVKLALYNKTGNNNLGLAASRFIGIDVLYQANNNSPIFYANRILNGDGELDGYNIIAIEANNNTNVTIPNNLFSLGDDRYARVRSTDYIMFNTITDNVEKITFPQYIENIYIRPEAINIHIKEFAVTNGIFGSNSANYTVQDGVLFSDDSTVLIAYPRGNARTTYTVPSGVKSIASYAFQNVRNLKTLTVDAGVVYVGYQAFLNSSIENIIFNGAPNIAGGAFSSPTIKNIIFSYNSSYRNVYAEFNGPDVITNASKELTIYIPSAQLNNYKNAIFFEMTLQQKFKTYTNITANVNASTGNVTITVS